MGCRCTGSLIICSLAADTVEGVVEVRIGAETPLRINIKGIEIDHHIVAERRLKTRVTLCDIQRVGVIGDIEQVGHRGLTRSSAVVDVQACLLGPAVTEADIRRDIVDITFEQCIDSEVLVRHLGVLGNVAYTRIEVHLVGNVTEHQLYIVSLRTVFRVTAQAVIEIPLIVLGQVRQKIVVVECHQIVGKLIEDICRTVTIAVAVVETVIELKEKILHKRFGITHTQVIVPIV